MAEAQCGQRSAAARVGDSNGDVRDVRCGHCGAGSGGSGHWAGGPLRTTELHGLATRAFEREREREKEGGRERSHFVCTSLPQEPWSAGPLENPGRTRERGGLKV